tara:strand:- start:2890 stop:3216 length:327 start_codon:yes stop_codon:yes gene_type:complete
MTDKPEVVEFNRYGRSMPVYGCNRPVDMSGAYISLTDHEAARAADKARIAELQAALRKVAGEVDGNIRECVRDCVNQRGNVQDIYDYCDNIDTAIDAALAQQGKEGEK